MDKEKTVHERQKIGEKYLSLGSCLDERSRRLWAATEARAYGYGGIVLVSKAISMSNKTIDRGLKELMDLDALSKKSIRNRGAGRKSFKDNNRELLQALDDLVEPTSRGNPESPLR